MKLDLSPRQQRTVGYFLTLLAALGIAVVAIGLFVIMVRFFAFFSGVFLPLITAFVLSLILKPYYLWLKVVRGLKSFQALGVVYICFLIPLGVLLYVIFSAGTMAIEAVAEHGPGYVDRSEKWLETRMPQFQGWIDRNFGESPSLHADGTPVEPDTTDANSPNNLSETIRQQRGRIVGLAESFAGGVFDFTRGVFGRVASLLGWAVLPIYLGYFLLMRPVPKEERRTWFSFLKDDTQEDVLYLLEQFIEIMVSFFRGQFVVALVQAILYGIGFQIVGLQFGFLVGFFMGLINVVPYLGSLIGLGVALPLALMQPGGGWIIALLVMIVFVIVQAFESYWLTPKVMGERTGLHPMAIIVAIFFWGTAFGGVIGMILAIPLTAFLVVFWRLARKKQIFQDWF